MKFTSVGLDLSYSRTGISVINRTLDSIDSFEDDVSINRFRTSNEFSFIHRTVQIKQWVGRVLHSMLSSGINVEVLVIEGPALNGGLSAMMNGLDVSLMSFLYEEFPQQEMLVIPPRSLKKYIGVSGDSKTLVVNKFKEMFPKIKGASHDEADATFLALIGADYRSLVVMPGFSQAGTAAKYLLFNEELNGKGQKKGFLHREGEFWFPARSHV